MTESAVPVALRELAQGAPSGWPLCFSQAVQVTANQQGRGGPGWEEKEAGGSAVSSLCPEDVASRGNVTFAF